MSLNLLFDENFGKPIVRALASLLSFHELNPTVKHLLDLAPPGEPDERWIPRISAEDWIVVTKDKGAHGGSKLPIICRRQRVTHVLLVGRLTERRQFEQVRAVLVVWPNLIRASDVPRGSRFRLRLAGVHPILELTPESP